ncbi:trichohyalin-like [Amphiprion ocellaris]|uniref:trichohyalin-like n=1 Tax=Amphiprion ocellaris TaxID=80972 RepID=UPI002410ED69|nr:trichohyalin-like [Amphiprion ocellaris]
MDRRLQQLLTEKQQFFKWAEVSKIRTCKLEELLMSQNRQIIQLQEKLGPESHKNTEQDQASSKTPAPAMTWANVVKGLGKAKQPVILREFQASSETPAPTMTSANVVKAEEEVKEPVILSEDQASSETQTTTMNWADVMEAEDEVREQLRLREAEVSQLKLENEGLLAMLQEAKNLQRELDHKENEDLNLQVKFLVDKNKSLKEENNKLQKDKQAAVEKTEKLEGKIQLMERNNIPQIELNEMKKYIKTLQTEKIELEGDYNRRFLQMKNLESLLFQESYKTQEILKSLESAHELIAIREQELDRITGINENLSAALFKSEELLLEAGNEVEEKEKEKQEIVKSLKSAQELITIRDQELQRITGINENSSETLIKTEELLVEAGNEVEEKEKQEIVKSLESAEEVITIREQELQQITDSHDNLSEMLLKTEELLVEAGNEVNQKEKENQELLKKQEETEHGIQKKNKKRFCKFFRRTKDRQSNQKKTEEVIGEREEPQEQEKKAKKKKSFWSWFKSNRKVEEAAGSSA